MDSKISIQLLKKDMEYLKQGIEDIKKELCDQKQSYIPRLEFEMVNKDQNNRIGRLEKLVFGAVALALTTLGKTILDLVVTVRAGS